MKPKKHGKATAKEANRSLSEVVGADIYAIWVRMLHQLVPDGRTHRLTVMVAGMLQYAVAIAAAKSAKERYDGSLAAFLLEASEANDPRAVEDFIDDAVVKLFFKDAKVRFERINARGDQYSLANDSYEEFIRWFDMP